MSDYLYGKIAARAIDIDYRGIETDTTKTIVDNDERTIEVDVKPLSPSILDVSLPSSSDPQSYLLNADVAESGISYSWKNTKDVCDMDEIKQLIDQKVQELTSLIDELKAQIEDIKNK